ncbi:MAG: hypothetical protein KDD52_07595 [Bdellovibrionales bacterium]|nr:hypothetical protein [Bdellovibrionales bacterium]
MRYLFFLVVSFVFCSEGAFAQTASSKEPQELKPYLSYSHVNNLNRNNLFSKRFEHSRDYKDSDIIEYAKKKNFRIYRPGDVLVVKDSMMSTTGSKNIKAFRYDIGVTGVQNTMMLRSYVSDNERVFTYTIKESDPSGLYGFKIKLNVKDSDQPYEKAVEFIVDNEAAKTKLGSFLKNASLILKGITEWDEKDVYSLGFRFPNRDNPYNAQDIEIELISGMRLIGYESNRIKLSGSFILDLKNSIVLSYDLPFDTSQKPRKYRVYSIRVGNTRLVHDEASFPPSLKDYLFEYAGSR